MVSKLTISLLIIWFCSIAYFHLNQNLISFMLYTIYTRFHCYLTNERGKGSVGRDCTLLCFLAYGKFKFMIRVLFHPFVCYLKYEAIWCFMHYNLLDSSMENMHKKEFLWDKLKSNVFLAIKVILICTTFGWFMTKWSVFILLTVSLCLVEAS